MNDQPNGIRCKSRRIPVVQELYGEFRFPAAPSDWSGLCATNLVRYTQILDIVYFAQYNTKVRLSECVPSNVADHILIYRGGIWWGEGRHG